VSQEPSSLIEDMVREALRRHQAGKLAAAERIYRQVLTIDPSHPDGLHLLGMVAYQTGRDEAAVELIRQAIAIKGNAASYHSNLGNVLQSQGKLTEAGACYQRALVLKPGLAEVHLNLGNIFKALGELDSSRACYERALVLKPGLAEAAVAVSMALLLKGEFSFGWQNFERRWETKDYDTPMRAYPWPRWKGERLQAGCLLVWGEQGIGDEIMYAGLVPNAIHTGNRCMLDCDTRLKPLFSRSFPDVEVVTGVVPESPLDIAAHLPSGSLPELFRRSSAAFGATTSPYLVADPVARGRFRDHYADGRKLVGLAWHTKNRKTGRSRSIALPLLTPLLTLSGIRWVSLQYGDHEALEEEAAAAGAPILIDRAVDQLSDLDIFAAQIAAMDLVITIDNSTAHLAGALGVPVWVLLPFAPDWRWLLDREDCPWYPTMRLFRQTELGNWQSVVERVRRSL
jgi:Tfp pilus assembly protein PilF